MEYTGKTFFKAAVTGLTQSAGAKTIDVSDSMYLGGAAKRKWQIQVAVSETPTAGTLAVGVKTPGASGFVSVLDAAIDLTAGPGLITFEAVAEAIRITPTSFDDGKTYSVFLAASN